MDVSENKCIETRLKGQPFGMIPIPYNSKKCELTYNVRKQICDCQGMEAGEGREGQDRGITKGQGRAILGNEG